MQSKSVTVQSNDYLNKLYESIKGQNRPTITTIHMTDPHLDSKYSIGTDMFCTMPLCCRAENGYPTESWRQAGKWGAYPCDLPEVTIRSML